MGHCPLAEPLHERAENSQGWRGGLMMMGGTQQRATYDELAGYFGPQSLTWRISGEAALLLGGGRAVLMQLAHPLVAAGVGHHSSYASDPWGRVNRTIDLMSRLTFGTRAEAWAAARTINRLHAGVVGTLDDRAGDLLPGAPYLARDPELLLWVYATLVDTSILLYSLLVGPLVRAERERYYQESRTTTALLGLPPSLTPPTLADFETYMRDMLASDRLAITPAARAVARQVMHMPVPIVLRPVLMATEQFTIGVLPPRLRALYGYTWDEHRQALLTLTAAGARHLLPLLPPLVREMPQARAARRRVRQAGAGLCA